MASLEELLSKRIATLSQNHTQFLLTTSNAPKIAYYMGEALDAKDVTWKKFVEKLKADFSIAQVSGQMIRDGCLVRDGFDILFMPGGDPAQHVKLMGEEEGMRRVKEFLSLPLKGYVGSCAGAYCAMAMETMEGYPKLQEFMPKTLDILEGFIIKDREVHNWKRGFGTSYVKFTEIGKEIFGEKRDEASMFYRNGPILHVTDSSKCQVLCEYTNEFTVDPAVQKGFMIGSAASVCGRFEGDKGRVLLFSAHPETSGDDMNQLLINSFKFVITP
ncbi:predicted protein [Naegleria gruberi]|uniref:Predicted protein n=1 Tax=Naegleria gruberi TaxID=5762 RepID=D2VB30_NAEGR|nr:uncharacterized protein NAEGRDRAFT_66069 [Naegleria gruberi]EFC46053.1 predicted protein [Naegleria gruberi]|eukprot:XP_002678797.1 predicted protein [Naegleria gruberi strain NEG-M]